MLGISVSALIRRAVDHELERDAISTVSGSAALAKIKHFQKTYKAPGEEPYQFDWGEIYRGRLSRYDADPDWYKLAGPWGQRFVNPLTSDFTLQEWVA
jgi:hypothetical protein